MELNDAIKELFDSIPGNTKAAKLRAMMPEIDRRIREGVDHQAIVDTLNEHGFNMTLNTFRSNLFRYRKREGLLKTSPRGGIDKSPVRSPVPKADGNSQVTSGELDDTTPDDEPATNSEKLEQLFSAKSRGDLGDKYLNQSRLNLGKKRSPKE
ncbi:hypothetical protein [Brucella cytisi]|uniref:hypothetical protein n=1 Tax=Brucella cytisi TaxID=407152 RepID=UPI00116078AE|nr:hypothetical protein [Brucella cytisi]